MEILEGFRMRALLIVILALFALVGTASADEKLFKNPLQGKNRLDYCFSWQTGCGQQAADAWCVDKGFAKAAGFEIAKGAGLLNPTRTIGDGSVCDGASCDSFATISCYKAGAGDVYIAPKVNGVRVDWCFAWQKGCGQKAADAFCQSKGYAMAAKFSKAASVGPTRVLSTGQLCDDTNCDGFASLQCSN
ncbi:MAG: hypothetical protein QM702_10510 [Rubrivivax sp.]